MTMEYQDRLRSEIERFRTVENVHDLPAIFHIWANKYVLPKMEGVFGVSGVEQFYARYISQYITENPGREARIASLGAGNGDFEVRIALLLRNAGFTRFRFQCLDVNPAMLERGRETASKESVSDHFEFLEADIAHWTNVEPIGVVIANHSLHHIQELERTFEMIRKGIDPNGYFLSCDMIGRNGHMRWPEALEVIQDIWHQSPDRYKYNHLLRRFEETYENWDCSTEGFEGIRAQDILPLLVKSFRFEAFVAFGNLPDIFVDRCFGHNLDPSNKEDVEFVDRIGELNDRLISEGAIKPTQMIAVMRTRDIKPPRYYQHWTPEFCVRKVDSEPA